MYTHVWVYTSNNFLIENFLLSVFFSLSLAYFVHTHTHSFIFWTDWARQPRIVQARMDGSDHRLLLTSRNGIRWPNGITLDIEHEVIYFVDGWTRRLWATDYRAQTGLVKMVDEMQHNLLHPYDVIFYNDLVFWSDWGSPQYKRRVSRVRVDPLVGGANQLTMQETLVYQPSGIQLVSDTLPRAGGKSVHRT